MLLLIVKLSLVFAALTRKIYGKHLFFLLLSYTPWGDIGQKLISEGDIEEKKFGKESVFSLYEDKSPLSGAYKIAQGNGEYYEASFVDGKLHGVAKYYDREGRIMGEKTYKSGQLTGVSKEYHPNGKVKKEAELTQGVFSGFYREYGRSGVLYREYHYKDGALEGRFREFSDEKVTKDCNYKAGKPDGLCRVYDEGKLIEEEHYKMGEKDGKQWYETYYDRRGGIRQYTTEYYKNGTPTGKWETRLDDGTLREQQVYKGDGSCVRERYYENGKLREMATLKGGKLHGPYKYYNDLGQLQRG